MSLSHTSCAKLQARLAIQRLDWLSQDVGDSEGVNGSHTEEDMVKLRSDRRRVCRLITL